MSDLPPIPDWRAALAERKQAIADGVRGILAARNAAIVEQVRRGASIKAAASAAGIPYATAHNIVSAHEAATGKRLPRGKRGPKGSGGNLSARNREIVAAYRAMGTLDAVGQQYGISRERVRQIVAKYERLTGETIPRMGFALAGQRKIAARPIWRCPDCGEERRETPSDSRNHKRCMHCHTRRARKHLSDELIADTIRRVLAGERWHPLALAAGYAPTGTAHLPQAVYLHLKRLGDAETIARLWPRGVPHWLRRRFGEPPSAGRAA